MRQHDKEIEEQEMVTLDMAYWGFLIGTCALLSMWFISGLYFII
jgi:hypothetical protein